MLMLKEQESVLETTRAVILNSNWVPRLPVRGECCLMTALDRACYNLGISRYSITMVIHRLMTAIPDKEQQSTLARWNDQQKDVKSVIDLIDRALDKLRKDRQAGSL